MSVRHRRWHFSCSGDRVHPGERQRSTSLFPADYRASGVLLHVTSLPSPYGVGDLGPAAVAWIDWLRDAAQGWWQSLPLGPTGYADSPYQPLSSFAGNVLLISPEWLAEDGLIRETDRMRRAFPATVVDYDAVRRFKSSLIDTAWRNFRAERRPDLQTAFERFQQDNGHWLDDYALFTALKARYAGAGFYDWPESLVRRDRAALERARADLASEIERACLAQFLFFRQATRLRAHARARGVRLIGDLPFFVSADSSDVWAHPELFLLDAQHRPRVVAGVPPDYFSAQGQRWGNPVYDWDALRERKYDWWIARARALLHYLDAVRLDHFRGFSAAWHIPASAPTAEQGEWVPGPGAGLFAAVERAIGGLPFIAEDLGTITADVSRLRDAFRLPGTRVLQFAFDGDADNPHSPQNFVHNAVVYTGTHDNPTTGGWYAELPESVRRHLWRVSGRAGGNRSDAVAALLQLAWSSVAALAIAPLQDVLALGNEACMNRPGRTEGNWRWRVTEDLLSASALEPLRVLTTAAGRFADLDAAGRLRPVRTGVGD
jgi:4-alpha-glucanotransferase